MNRVKYVVKYRLGNTPKQVTGFVRIGKDLQEGFTSQQFIDWVCLRHNLVPELGLEITLKNYTSKNFRYANTFRQVQAAAVKKVTGNRN